MKQTDFKPCAGCGKGVMHNNVMIFYKINVANMAVNLDAVRRQHGLEMMMGSATIAHIMGPDEDMAQVVGTDHDGLVCLDCAMTKPVVELLQNMIRTDDENQEG